jgi:hypothetical protein
VALQSIRDYTTGTIVLALVAGCATSGSEINQVLQHPDYRRAGFNNVLVIAVADDYEARAQFERQVVSGIRANGASATAYYTVVGNNPPVTRTDVQMAVQSRGFDAVLLTRVAKQGSTVAVKGSAPDAQATVRGGNVVDLFRYDYEEFNEPDRVEISSSVTLITELYAAAKEEKVWAIESTSSNYAEVAQLIDAEVKTIVARLKKDQMVGS